MFATLLRAMPLLAGVFLVAAAAAHRWILGEPGYTGHWLVGVEMVLLVTVLILIFIQMFHGVSLMAARKWREMLVTFISLFLTGVLLLAAMVIHSPTLIFAT